MQRVMDHLEKLTDAIRSEREPLRRVRPPSLPDHPATTAALAAAVAVARPREVLK
jgi:hypothetical protein